MQSDFTHEPFEFLCQALIAILDFGLNFSLNSESDFDGQISSPGPIYALDTFIGW